MPSQSELIGDHPNNNNPLGRFFAYVDKVITATQRHRALDATIPANNAELIDWMARRLIHHHHDDNRLQRLRAKYQEAGFPQYAEQTRKLPRADKTKKGNATEILLIEYIEGCLGKLLFKAYKLRYNPNVDQAMKGDDTLGVDLYKEGEIDKAKIYMGEAKFRQTPTRQVINEITTSLSDDKKPLSYTYLIDELSRDVQTKSIADIIDNIMLDEVKGNRDLIYAGFLLSNKDVEGMVDTHLSSNNNSLVFISVGIDNPEQLITESFRRAEELILTPDII